MIILNEKIIIYMYILYSWLNNITIYIYKCMINNADTYISGNKNKK